MKTNKTNLKSRIFAVMVSVMLLATCFMSTTAFAETPDETVQITKYLVMDKEANVPNVDFEFTIAAGGVENVGGQVVYAGVEGATITDKATFTTESTTYDTVQEGDSVTIAEGQKYAKDVVAVDFTGVDFTAPGLYHYTVTETDTSYTGITEDAKTYDLYVLVAVDDTDDTLYIAGATFSYMDDDAKLTGMTNTYTTHNITLSKTVTGNQGDRNKYFEFTVTINNAIDGTVYNVTGDFTANTDLNGDLQADNPTTLTATGGTVVQKYYLKDGQNIVINGVADGSTYLITETNYTNDGYATTFTINGESATFDTGRDVTADDVVAFTNTKNGTVPTGILLETAPYMILGAVVLAGIVVLFVTRRRRSH